MEVVVSNVPKLRFKDFNQDWRLTRLDQLIELQSGYAFKSEYFTDTQGRKLVIPKNFTKNGFGNFEQSLCKFTSEGYDNKYVCKANDLLILLTDLTPSCELLGKPLMVRPEDGELLLNQRIARVVKKGTVNTEYLKNYFLTEPFCSRIKNTATGSTVRHSSNKIILETETLLPSPSEQQKIAAFLTAVDTKIEQLTKKEQLLQQYKKGVMQKIFSQEIRFKADDGNEFPEWENLCLGDIGDFKTSSVDKKIIEGEKIVHLVNYMNVYRHEEINTKAIPSLMQVSAKDQQIEISNLKRGDILFTPSSETPDDIGHSAVMFEDLPNTVYSYHLMRFRPKVKLDVWYSHYFCNNDDVLKQICQFATGSTRFSISITDFSKIRVSMPCYEEQTKIGHFLSNLDRKIKVLNSVCESAKLFKKGLLQQMFV